MLFNSLEFLVLFLPVVLAVSLRLRGNALLGWISFSSLVFYAFAGHAWFLIPMAVTTVLDYAVGRKLEGAANPRGRRALLLVSLVGNLGLLAYFKYSGLLLRTTQEALAAVGLHGMAAAPPAWLAVVLPAGISFYTFQTLSYVLDIYRGDAHSEPNFLKYLGFVAFFPHLVAGPLTRHSQLIPQLSSIAAVGIAPRWKSGIYLFAIGLVKKVLIADRIAGLIDPVIGDIGHAGVAGAWLAMVGYSLQIYFDFSGYSDMAIGLGRMFSVDLPQNFDSPYKARNPSDFWRRWHITLSLWLRDYLYISLGGNRRGVVRTRINLMITMTLGGLWHGANWTFAVWGIYHGGLLVLYHRFAGVWDGWRPSLQRGLMYVLVCVGWVFFRSPDLATAGTWLAGLVGVHGLIGEGGDPAALAKLAALALVSLVIAMAFKNAYEHDLGALRPRTAALLGGVTALAVVMMNFSSKFLYFQF